MRGISIASARQAHFLRLSIELEVVRTLAQKNDAALGQSLQSLVLQQRAALKANDLESFYRVDHAFHRQLYVAAEVEELWRLMRHRSGNMDRLRRLHLPLNGKADQILKDHAAIADAIAQGDAAAAEAALRRHLSGTLSELDALREQYPNYWMPGAD